LLGKYHGDLREKTIDKKGHEKKVRENDGGSSFFKDRIGTLWRHA
jgi:hypothetical protein